jgi:hypothetical protein
MQGTQGLQGTNGEAGANGNPGQNAEGGGTAMDATTTPSIVVLSAHAQIGLASAPVSLALSGKTTPELEQIGQGSYIVNNQAICTDCHSKSPAPTDYLSGGVTFPIGPTSNVVSRNLTPDVTGLKDTVDQYIQATRNGTDTLNGNEALIVHPWQYERWMGTDDLHAIYSYLLVVPAISNTPALDMKPAGIPAETFPGVYNEGQVVRFLPPEVDAMDAAIPDPGHILRGTAIDPLDVAPPTDPTQASLFGRGSYLVNAVVGCPQCHSNPDRDYQTPTNAVNTNGYMKGGTVFAARTAAPVLGVVRSMTANLIGKTHGFFNGPNISFQVFLTTITQGVHGDEQPADGGALRPLAWPMPWAHFRNMGVDDLEALYTYLRWLAVNAPASTGDAGSADLPTQDAARYCTADSNCNTGETCNTATNECIGRACSVDSDCDTCQTCTSSACAAPSATSPCVLTAH